MLKEFFQLIYPHTCVCCDEVIPSSQQFICKVCNQLLPYIDPSSEETYRKLAGRVNVNSAVSYLRFNKSGMVQKLLHELKYNQNPEIGIFLGKEFKAYLNKSNLSLPADGLIPVPVHNSRLKTRGYNQAEMIAKGLVENSSLNVDVNSLLKTRESQTQTKKGRSGRLDNLKECFQLSASADLKNKHVGLVDDVITTGATIEACCMSLFKAGVSKISVFCIATA